MFWNKLANVLQLRQLMSWNTDARDSPLYALLLNQRNMRFITGTHLILLTIMATTLTAAVHLSFYYPRSPLVGAIQAAFLICCILQMTFAWIQPKLKWEDLRRAGVIEQIQTTPMPFSAVLGPFVLLARRQLYRSVVIIFLTVFFSITVAYFSVLFFYSLSFFQTISGKSFWPWFGLTCYVLGYLLEPSALLMESSYWRIRATGAPVAFASILSCMAGIIFAALHLFILLGSLALFEFLDYIVLDQHVALLFLTVSVPFWIIGYIIAQRLLADAMRVFSDSSCNCAFHAAPSFSVEVKEEAPYA